MRDAALVTADAPVDRLDAPIAGTCGHTLIEDRLARCLLRRAQGAFQKWPEGFGGFRASARCETAAGVIAGRVTVETADRIDVACDDPHVAAALHDMLRAIVLERTPRFFDEADGRFPICFADGECQAAGRPIRVQVRSGELRYWVDTAGRIRQVERIARGLRTVMCHEELTRTTPGRLLPTRSTVYTWDVASGALLGAESIHDSHRRVDHVWLPAARRISRPRDDQPRLWLLLEAHQLL